jgi:hypothetical protein
MRIACLVQRFEHILKPRQTRLQIFDRYWRMFFVGSPSANFHISVTIWNQSFDYWRNVRI